MAKIELTQQVQWILASTYGWTGNWFTKFTWPTTAERVFTLPDSSSTLLYSWWALGTPASWTLTSCTWLPLTTGVTWILPIANWGTGSATRNFMDLTSTETTLGLKTFSNDIKTSSLYLRDNWIEVNWYNSEVSLAINYNWYNWWGTQWRNFAVYDWKQWWPLFYVKWSTWNVSIWTIYPSRYTSYKMIDLNTALGIWAANDTTCFINRNWYYNWTNWIYKTTSTLQHLALTTAWALELYTSPSWTAWWTAILTKVFEVTNTGSITTGTWNWNTIAIANWGTGSSTQNFVDLSTNQTVAWDKTLSWTTTTATIILNRLTGLNDFNTTSVNPIITASANSWPLVYPFSEAGNLVIQPRVSTWWGQRDVVFIAWDSWWVANIRMVINRVGWVLIWTTTHNTSAKLQISSTTQWFLPPVMTTTQKNAIASPATLLIVWDTDLNKYQYYTGSAWSDFVTSISGITGTMAQFDTAVTDWNFVYQNQALWTPSSWTVTNLTWTASININGTVWATTPTTASVTTLQTSSNVGIGVAPLTNTTLTLAKNLTGATGVNGAWLSAAVLSDVTVNAFGFRTNISTQATAFTLVDLIHFYANQSTIGAGSAVTNQYGFIAESTLIGATNNYGFRANIAAATGRWNFYANWTAQNYFAGNIGRWVTVPTAGLHLAAGTATASTAPIKLTTWVALTTPEDWVIEYYSSHLYFTIWSTRYQLDQQTWGGWLTWWASISAGTWIWITMASTDLAWDKAFQSSTHTASGTLTACTTTQNTYATSRTYTLTSWSVTDNFIWTLFSRTNVTTWAGGTLLAQGPVVQITWTDTQTAWTLTPSYNLLELVPSLRSTWSSIKLTVANSVVTAPTNGHIYAVLGNTQTVAQTLLKLDIGTSAVAHTWLLIKAYNASSTCYGINIDPSTTCTWAWIYISNTWWNLFKWVKFDSIWSWALVWYWIFQDTVNANSWSTWVWYWIYQSTVQANTWAWIWYWLYQENIKTWSWWWNWYWIYQWTICWWSNAAVGYWIYQNIISTNDSAISYGWYVGNIWNVATSTWKYFSLNNAQSSSSLSARTTNTAEWLFSRTNTATSWIIADNYNWLYFKRTSVQNGAWWTLTSTWSVLALENVATQTAWTLTDTTPLLKLTQSNNSTWWHILFNAYSWVPTTDWVLYFDWTNFKARIWWVTKTFTIT